jgi:hypothetical protein
MPGFPEFDKPDYFVLVGRTPIACDIWMWCDECKKRQQSIHDSKGEKDPWRIGRDVINDSCFVSTIFLGLDHGFGFSKDPILFETMIFGGPLSEDQWRYSSYAQAEQGHAEAVTAARIACAKVKSIADAAGAKQKVD